MFRNVSYRTGTNRQHGGIWSQPGFDEIDLRKIRMDLPGRVRLQPDHFRLPASIPEDLKQEWLELFPFSFHGSTVHHHRQLLIGCGSREYK
jgi:hypothetical protein